ncbi:MAG TPA: hypothetical protein VJ793_04950 [Anaerolineae bacterium]|nr:hypothetical protein [Anaerolineae bacterium]
MDDRDKLTAVLDKLNSDDIRLLARFAQIMIEEDKADPIHDPTDLRERYAQFKMWCESNSLDLAAVDAWVEETRQADDRAAAPRSS